MVNNCKKCGASLVVSTIIESFYPNSDAEKSSLKVGDKILEINKIPVDTNADIIAHEQVNGLVSVKIERKNQKLMFLVPDSDGFFTDQITYKEICKHCEKKKQKRKVKNFFDKVILGMFCLLVITLAVIIFMLVSANKMDDDIPESAESIVAENLNIENTENINSEDTQEILLDSPEQRWEKIEQLLRSSNVFENEILYLALNSDDYALFDTVLQDKYSWRKMFTVVDNLDTKSSIVRGYDLDTIDDETLMLLANIKATELGKIYYDYGEWLEPSDKYPGRGKYNLAGNIFDEMRFYETASALTNILAKIPADKMKNACFVIDGHTDSVSDHDFNQALSERRANSIKKIMNGMFGIPQHRIVTQGFSWDKKAVENETTPNDFAMNRRAEIKVCFFEEQ
jgi:cell division protein FtsL